MPRIIAGGEVFNVEYEGLKLICFECGRYGHRREACPWKKSSQHPHRDEHEARPSQRPLVAEPSSSPEIKAINQTQELHETFGPCMFVSGTKESRISREKNQGERHGVAELSTKYGRKGELTNFNSRYKALESLEEYEAFGDRGVLQDDGIENGKGERKGSERVPQFKKQAHIPRKQVAARKREEGASKNYSRTRADFEAQEQEINKPICEVNEATGGNKSKTGHLTYNGTLVDQSKNERPKLRRQREHHVICGEMGHTGQNNHLENMALDKKNQTRSITQEDVKSPPQTNNFNASGELYRKRRLSISDDAEPPDPGNMTNEGQASGMEENDTVVADEGLEDVEFVPETLLSR